jgi:hypothetical protein
MTVPIYCNNAFGYGRGLVNKLDDNFFNITHATNPRERAKILSITWSEITVNNRILPLHIVSETFGINLSNAQYENIKNAYKSACNRFRNNDNNSTNLNRFFSGFKKGSQPFRRILAAHSCMSAGGRGDGLSRTVTSFSALIDCRVPNTIRQKSLFCSWNKRFIDSRMRIFKFKYYNNILGLNSRVAHFNQEVSAGCTLCNISGPRPVASETMDHLFYSCPFTQKMLSKVKEKYINNADIQRESYFWGIVSEDEKENICVTIFFDVFRYLIWQSKLDKKIPTVSEFISNLDYKLNIICNSSRKIEHMFRECTTVSLAGYGAHRVGRGP